MSDDIHEIYAIKYGRHERKKAENYIGGDPHDVPEPIDYFVWAIIGPSGTFVVDTGFDAAMAKKRGRMIAKPIAEGLKAIDIAPDSIKNVIVSHLHYDHCGNYDTFPNARFHLQDTEMAYATGRCMCHQHLRVPFEEEDVVAMVRKVFAGRVTFHDGVEPDRARHHGAQDRRALEGPAVRQVKTKRGAVVLASDTTHLYAHIERGPRVSHHLQCGRGARRLRDDEEARRLAQPRRSGARSAGAGVLPGREAPGSKGGWRGSMSIRKAERGSASAKCPFARSSRSAR